MAKRAWLLAIVGALGALGVWHQSRPKPPAALLQWTNVAARADAPRGTGWAAVEDHPAVAEALRGRDPERLRGAMRDAHLDGIWFPVEVDAPSVLEARLEARFSAGQAVRGFRGELLTTEGLLYVADDTRWPVALSDQVLARVARGILEGSAPPPPDAFPEAFLEPQSVEILVLLRGAFGPRLWRSARSQSIADGVVTAALAARERWEERMESMGGPLGERLDQLDVEVAFLFDDGTFDSSVISLIDALVKPRHGVAYEQPARWRYQLPRATHAAPTPTEAFRRLFAENGLPEDSFDREDIRLYRIRMQTVSIDQGSAGSRRAGAPSLGED